MLLTKPLSVIGLVFILVKRNENYAELHRTFLVILDVEILMIKSYFEASIRDHIIFYAYSARNDQAIC